MSWLQLHLEINDAKSGPLEAALLNSGAVSVTLADSVTHADNASQPILEPGVGETPLWQKIRLTALYPADIDTDVVLLQIGVELQTALPPWRWETLEDQVWERAWMEHYQPIQCGQRLWICPSWCGPPDPSAINLMLDPGLAFGTGSHPTTMLCLQWLDGLDINGKTVIDYGCGSGILAIAAALLGAAQVIAVDNDPQALLATTDNAQRNGIGKDQLMVYLPDDQPQLACDYLVANILAAPLIELSEHFLKSTRAGGQICLSGIVDTQFALVTQAYTQNVEFGPAVNQDEWLRLVATKK